MLSAAPSVSVCSAECWNAYDTWQTHTVPSMPRIQAHPPPQIEEPPPKRRKYSRAVYTKLFSEEYSESDLHFALQEVDSGECLLWGAETLKVFQRDPPPKKDNKVATVSGDQTFDFECGYCKRVKPSNSEGSDGRVRIRCECGGKHKDNIPRMHAQWVKIGTVESNKPESKDAQIQALHAKVEALEAENQELRERIQSS